jgi:hypothetical protein
MSGDSSKDWMFHCTVEMLHTMDWDHSVAAVTSHARGEAGIYRLWADYSEDIL